MLGISPGTKRYKGEEERQTRGKKITKDVKYFFRYDKLSFQLFLSSSINVFSFNFWSPGTHTVSVVLSLVSEKYYLRKISNNFKVKS